MTASARLLLLLPRQLTIPPLRSALAPASSGAAARGYFLMVLLQQQQQPHRCWARAAASSASNCSSSCERYPQALIAAAPGATCPHDGKGDGREAARCGEKAAGAQQDDGSGAGAPSPPDPKDKSEALRAAGRKCRSGATPSPRQQRGRRTAKPQVNKPARPGPPKQGRGGGGGIIHAAPRSSSTSPSSTSSTRLRTTKKQESED